MKVELDNVILGYSPLSGSVFAGIENKPSVWGHKVEITQSFITCVIQKYVGKVETIESASGEQWEITVKKIK